ncbi:MAG: GNAT family N-acetyltransferase [Bacteroidota bacterium]
MKDQTTYKLIDNEAQKRYEFHIDGHKAILEYIKVKDKIYLTHTEVPKALGGQGIGSQLVLQVLQLIDEQHLTLVPLCPFVAMYIKRHPEWRRVVMRNVNF